MRFYSLAMQTPHSKFDSISLKELMNEQAKQKKENIYLLFLFEKTTVYPFEKKRLFS